MYEGAPDYPDKDIWWELVERYKVTLFYTAPTAIRACMKWGAEHPGKHDLSSLRLLGTVGEPINPKAWLWYHKVIGGERCPIVDTWWQTETGAIMITTLPGIQDAKPGSAGTPLPGIEAAVVDQEGEDAGTEQGFLTLRKPWPSMLRTLYKEDDRFVETYWSKYGKDVYFVGDAARRDEDGYFWIIGRVDDVINVSGHRLSTAEVESAIVSHEHVAEAAVIGQQDEDTGQAITAFVTLSGTADGSDELVGDIREHVAKRIGKLARPKRIIWADDLPKTRSGKIMRRLLRDIAEGRELGDVDDAARPGRDGAARGQDQGAWGRGVSNVARRSPGGVSWRPEGETPCPGHRRLRAAGPPDHGAGDERHRLVADDPGAVRRSACVSFDNRGVGRSERVPGPYTAAEMADDAVSVLDEAGVESAHVYGISLGGMIAQEVALRHPDRVRALVLGGDDARRLCARAGERRGWRVRPAARADDRRARGVGVGADQLRAAHPRRGRRPDRRGHRPAPALPGRGRVLRRAACGRHRPRRAGRGHPRAHARRPRLRGRADPAGQRRAARRRHPGRRAVACGPARRTCTSPTSPRSTAPSRPG